MGPGYMLVGCIGNFRGTLIPWAAEGRCEERSGGAFVVRGARATLEYNTVPLRFCILGAAFDCASTRAKFRLYSPYLDHPPMYFPSK
eukprot:scaffold197353_cov33-Tisochrysis_lutea.AAC.3